MAFERVGKYEADGYGARPLGWRDLLAFSRLMQINIGAWTAECLVAMSGAYVSEALNPDKDRFAPWYERSQSRRDKVDQKVRALLGG